MQPDSGFKYAYNPSGQQMQIPVGSSASQYGPGWSDTAPATSTSASTATVPAIPTLNNSPTLAQNLQQNATPSPYVAPAPAQSAVPAPAPAAAPTAQPATMNGNFELVSGPNLGPGATGNDVLTLQNWLVEQGYLTDAQVQTGPGTYGPQTKAAVAAWQAANGIDTQGNPGYFGPLSKAFLNQQSVAQGTPATPIPQSPTGTPQNPVIGAGNPTGTPVATGPLLGNKQPTAAPTGAFGSDVQNAMGSGSSFPSSVLSNGQSTNALYQKAVDAYAQMQTYQSQILAASTPSEEENRLNDELDTLNQELEQGIVNIRGERIATPLIGQQSQKLQENYAFKIKPLQDRVNSLIKARSTQVDALTRVMQASSQNIQMLQNIQALSQPDVLGTNVNDQTGDVFAIVKSPDGNITMGKIGNVGSTNKAKSYTSTGTYQDGNGQQYFYGVLPNGTIENIQLAGAPTPKSTTSQGGFELSAGQTRYDAQGNPIASLPANPTAGTESERAAAALSSFQRVFVPGAKLPDGTAVVDSNGYVTPGAWKEAIADAPSEGLSRTEFIKAFGYLLYAEDGKVSPSYGLTAQEMKLITGA